MAKNIQCAVLLLACMASAAYAAFDGSVSVSMTGAPDKVKTRATGEVKAVIDMTAQTIVGTLRVKNIKDVTMAHFHIGGVGVNGGVAAWLWPTDSNKPAIKQPFSVGRDWWTVPFTISAADVIKANATANTPAIANFNDLLQAMIGQKIYANVHTKANPGGEIRGQTLVALTSKTPGPKPTPKPSPKSSPMPSPKPSPKPHHM